MKTEPKISTLPPDSEVTVLVDVDEGFLSFETTAGTLKAKGYGSLKFECEDLDTDVPTVIAKNMEEFDSLKAVFGKTSPKRDVWKKLGRPALPEGKRASQLIQIRVTAERKEFYTYVASLKCMNLSEWMLWVCDKSSGYTV